MPPKKHRAPEDESAARENLSKIEEEAHASVAGVLKSLETAVLHRTSSLRSAMLNVDAALTTLLDRLADDKLERRAREAATELTPIIQQLDAAHQAAYPNSSDNSDLGSKIEELQERIGDASFDFTDLESAVKDLRNALSEAATTGLEEVRDAFSLAD